MQKHVVHRPSRARRRRRPGSVPEYVETFAEKLSGLGYDRSTLCAHRSLLCRFDEWRRRRDLTFEDLNEGVIARFLRWHATSGRWPHGCQALLDRFLHHLRASGATPSATPVRDHSPWGRLEHAFREHLRAERGLCATTIENYCSFLRRFLSERLDTPTRSVSTLTAADVSAFVRRHAHDRGPATAKMMVTGLRALFRFLFQTGELALDLSAAVPPIRDWRLATIPKAIPPEDVERVVNATDLHTATGRRDRAVLLLLARLGLRAGEIVAMELDDIDWRAGELTIRGKKGLRYDRFPLPADVGEALARYLRRDRPATTSRRVFFCMRAPRRPFANKSVITGIMDRAITRAGLEPPVRGAHLLRHSLAIRMLRQGASFTEIGQVLRHRLAQTTEIYAKVDLDSLRSVVQPWPGTGGGQ
jgi:integrase/recombinase XerD